MIGVLGMMVQEMTLKQKRTVFIADRVAITLSIMLAAIAMLTLGIQIDHSVDRVLSYWWTALVLPIVGAILLVSMRHLLFFKFHWGVIAVLNSLIWFPLTLIVGLALDKYFVGVGNAYWVSVNLLFAYGLGYVAARWYGIYRHCTKSPKMFAAWMVYLVFLLVVGILVFPVAMAKLVQVLTGGQINMLHFILCAFGVPASCLLNYYMLYALHDEKGMNVIQDPPNKLFHVCLRNTMVLMLIFWVLLLALIPPLAGGGGGGGGGGGHGGGSGGSGGRGTTKNRAVLQNKVEKAKRKMGEFYTMENLIEDTWRSLNLSA